MIGFKIMTLLLEAGYNVRAAVRDQAGFNKISTLPPVFRHSSQLTCTVVPDITVPGAYDEAVQDVEYIIHVASPLVGHVQEGNPEVSYLQPAIRGSVRILESAVQVSKIRRIVITGSILSIASIENIAKGEIINGAERTFIYF